MTWSRTSRRRRRNSNSNIQPPPPQQPAARRWTPATVRAPTVTRAPWRAGARVSAQAFVRAPPTIDNAAHRGKGGGRVTPPRAGARGPRSRGRSPDPRFSPGLRSHWRRSFDVLRRTQANGGSPHSTARAQRGGTSPFCPRRRPRPPVAAPHVHQRRRVGQLARARARPCVMRDGAHPRRIQRAKRFRSSAPGAPQIASGRGALARAPRQPCPRRLVAHRLPADRIVVCTRALSRRRRRVPWPIAAPLSPLRAPLPPLLLPTDSIVWGDTGASSPSENY